MWCCSVRDDTSLYDSPKKGILNEALTDLYPSQVGMSGRQTTKEHRPDNDKVSISRGNIKMIQKTLVTTSTTRCAIVAAILYKQIIYNYHW